MDRDEGKHGYRQEFNTQDTYDTRQAKQRASIKWLLSKAYNNRIPENLREPFYRDHENQEHLKPQIVHTLASAELYCLAFGNIYSDPNYHNLNHGGFLQTLSRKGIPVPESADGPITETVLIKTAPIKLAAHIAMIEAMMELYMSEVVTADRVVAAVQRFTHGSVSPPPPQSARDALLLWVNQAQSALTRRIQLEGGAEPPRLPPVRDVQSLSDGAALAALISFYCPEELPWNEIKMQALPTMSDCVHNLCLVHEFSHHSLPSSVCHMMPEDVTYMRGDMAVNLLVMLADLFNVLEIHPVKCVRFPARDSSAERNSQGVAHRRSLPQPVTGIPDLRSHLTSNTSFTVSRNAGGAGMRRSIPSPYSESTFAGSPDSLDTRYMEERDMGRRGEDFVVHRNKTVPTLSSMIAEDPLLPARLRPSKEKGNQDTKTEERGESRDRAAGKPTSYEEARKPSYAGRRSRRNSLSEDSQLTLENFGGSQENLHLLGRNPDKDPAILLSAAAAQATRTSAQEARSTGVELIFAAGGDDDIEERARSPASRRDARKSPSPAVVALPTPSVPIRSSREDARSNAIDRIFADNGYGLEKQDAEKPAREPLKETQAANLVSLNHLLTHSKQGDTTDGDISGVVNSTATISRSNGEKMTSFASNSPNTTTWQMQKTSTSPLASPTAHQVPNLTDDANSSAILNIRMKLEEKRRLIESEKKRTELTMNKKRQQMGKAAFLQAVTKKQIKPVDEKASVGKVAKALCGDGALSQKDMREAKTQRWMEGCVPLAEEPKTPDSDHTDFEHFQRSIAQMDSNLHQMDADMQKIGLNETYLTTEERLNQQFNEFASQQQMKIANLVNQQQKLQSFAMQIAANQSLQNRTVSPMGMPPLQHRTSSPVAMAPAPLQHRTASPVNHTYTSFASSPPAKPISLSQLHLQSTAQSPSPGQFFLHEQQPRRTTWREQSDQTPNTWREPAEQGGTNTWRDREARDVADRSQTTWRDEPSQGFTLHEPRVNGSGPTPSPRSAAASPLHSRSLSSKPVVPPRQSTPRQPPAPAPSDHDMEPQSICFIGDEEDDKNRTHIQISSGSRTYRIPSPTRPHHAKNPFQQPVPENQPEAEKGFYISFDNEAPPKRPKPPLRSKRNSPKKERFATQVIESPFEERDVYRTRDDSEIMSREVASSVPFPSQPADRRTAPANISSGGPSDRRAMANTFSSPSADRHASSPISYSPDAPTVRKHEPPSTLVYSPATTSARPAEPLSPGVGLVITDENDPNAVDEMEKKKEKILLLSLQRRQHQEELKSRKEMEAQQRKEMDKLKEEERSRKKEEDKARRAAILEQYKLKKAIEEAEREGKVVDKAELLKLAAPKMRSKPTTTPRPRPKTIHVESGAADSGMGSSRGQRGSSNNLAERSHENSVFSRPLRRNHYRGSQDSLAGTLPTRGRSRESPCDENGPSPSRASASNLGRRGSYKTSRDTSEPPRNRIRPQYSTYQSGGLRNQKSNSLVNLSGSSTDQDSMVYRYGDTDSGLGRATPPRRAPSPGFNRHLTSPSGPGSLPPGLISKRRGFDDGASDVSSASSMMDYNGPRLYKQPATKSNRGIMLNAVEYCVFPGVVNKEAKRRVLEEISRSEAKHFLILFRDAGCQFRALYSYCPDSDEVFKLYGTGPKQVNENMFDRFFKYNSGGKCFAQIHTKHLTVTIDAFTIHNSLWQGKKVQLPSKKDMALVI